MLTKNLYRFFQNSHTRRDWFFRKIPIYGGKLLVCGPYTEEVSYEKRMFFFCNHYTGKYPCVCSPHWGVWNLWKFSKIPCVCELCTVKFDKTIPPIFKIVNLSNTVGKSTPHNNTEPTCKGTFETHIPQTGEICNNYAKLSNSVPTQRISLEKAFFSKFTIIFTDALKSETLLCVGIVLWYVETFKMF